MSGGDGFLTRWSRRKLAVEREEPGGPPGSPLPEPHASLSSDPGPAEEALTEEEIAALPRPEDLTPDSDIAAFLRKGVPDVLRKAALRRMWSLDSSIRDYVGDARDYAWDWNVPGGVPGNGPLLPGDELGESISRMFSRAPAEEEGARSPPDARGQIAESAAESDREPSHPDEHRPNQPEPSPAAERIERQPDLAGPNEAPEAIAALQRRPDGAQPGHALRRHGAAIPKFDLF